MAFTSSSMCRERFSSLIRRCLVDNPDLDPDEIYAEIERRYSDPCRRYHSGKHLDHCLQQFDLAAHEMDDADSVELAVWFHDVIYDQNADDNEAKSAEFFCDLLGAHVGEERVRRVRELILATQHRKMPDQGDERFIVDIDLSSFALPWDEFSRDTASVRAECLHMSDQDFYAAQVRFLRSLLERPTFFSTHFFRDRYESRAQDNLRRLLSDLKARGFS